MQFREIDVSHFPPEREKKLKEIYRFSLFKTVFYRQNLWVHSQRVSWIVEDLLPLAESFLHIDPEKARTLALVHDDAEIITGDIQAGHKAQMSKEELEEIDRREEEAIETLAERYPKEINSYTYRELLRSALKKDTLEAQLVSYADKLDAYGETVHEMLAGNTTLITSFAFYTRVLSTFHLHYPELAEFLKKSEHPFTGLDIASPMAAGEQITKETYASSFKPHTKESIHKTTDTLPLYDRWREVNMHKGGGEAELWLTEQRERF